MIKIKKADALYVEHPSIMPSIRSDLLKPDEVSNTESRELVGDLENIALVPRRNSDRVITVIRLTNRGERGMCFFVQTRREDEKATINTNVCLGPGKLYDMAVPTIEDNRVINPVIIKLKFNNEPKEEKFW